MERLHFVLIMRATARRVALIARSNAAEADVVVVVVLSYLVSVAEEALERLLYFNPKRENFNTKYTISCGWSDA